MEQTVNWGKLAVERFEMGYYEYIVTHLMENHVTVCVEHSTLDAE